MDLTFDIPKFNPGQDGNTTGEQLPGGLVNGHEYPADINAGDWSGYVLAGGPLGILGYKRIADVLASDPDSPLAAAGSPAALNHITAEARFTDGDGPGKYVMGHGVKYASGAAAGEPCMWFPVAGAFLDAHPDQLWVVGALFAVNGTAIPDTVDIDVGFYPLTVGGAADQIAYTLNDSGKIVETYGDGLSAGPYSRPNADRHADFATGGTQNYGLGVELHSALPADCVLDVSLSLQLSPY